MVLNWLIKEGKIIKISPNLERSNSLAYASEKTLNFAEKNKLNSENAGVLIGNYYEALIEILHACSYKNGFKILDHLSFVDYIQEILNNKAYSILFDKYRKIRNSIIYYGKNIEIETAKQGIIEIKELIKFVRGKLG